MEIWNRQQAMNGYSTVQRASPWIFFAPALDSSYVGSLRGASKAPMSERVPRMTCRCPHVPESYLLSATVAVKPCLEENADLLKICGCLGFHDLRYALVLAIYEHLCTTV